MKTVYLDHNATTPIDAEVAEVMYQVHREGPVNPASPHAPGRHARNRLEDDRSRIAELLGADTSASGSARVLFTSGGTESNNLALFGLVMFGRTCSPPAGNLVVSSLEHPSVREVALHLQRLGMEVRWLPALASGEINAAAAAGLIDEQTRLVSVMSANNETGVVQPIDRLVEPCQRLKVPLHTDAVQAVGKVPVDFQRLGVASLSASAHKFHGPRGIGLLVLQKQLDFWPLMYGGQQQLGYRPGTESVALVAGMCRALEIAVEKLEQNTRKMARARDQLQSLLQADHPEMVVNGSLADSRLPHTLNVSFPGLNRQALLMALDQQGVACSTGSACASGSSEPSPVLIAMGCPRPVVDGSLRISVGRQTTDAEVQFAAQIFRDVVSRLRRSSGQMAGIASRDSGPDPV